MVASGIRPNEITMVSVLSGIATLGTLKEARWAHKYIVENSIPLNDNLSAALIDMYAKCGCINTALEVLFQIRDKTSTVSPWNAIICGSAMYGHAKLSLEIFSDLQKRNIKLNSITFIGVLSACCHAGFVEAGERYFKSMKNVYNVEPNIKHYGCMVDLLGRAGRVEDAEKMIRSMPMKADVVIWGTLPGSLERGEMAAESLTGCNHLMGQLEFSYPIYTRMQGSGHQCSALQSIHFAEIARLTQWPSQCSNSAVSRIVHSSPHDDFRDHLCPCLGV
ncbi:hypothetical protein ACFX1X_022309 [Malus domestica]